MSSSKMIVTCAVVALGVGIGAEAGAYTAPAASPPPVQFRPAKSMANRPPVPPAVATNGIAPVPVSPAVTRPVDLSALLQTGLISGMRFQPQVASSQRLPVTVSTLTEILGLTAGDSAALQDIFEQARQSIYSQLSAAASVVPGEPGQLAISLSDLAPARDRVLRLHEAVKQLLGEEGYAVYESLGFKTSVQNVFHAAGLYATRVTVTRGTGGQYKIIYAPSQFPSQLFDFTDTNVPAEVLGPLATLIPGGF